MSGVLSWYTKINSDRDLYVHDSFFLSLCQCEGYLLKSPGPSIYAWISFQDLQRNGADLPTTAHDVTLSRISQWKGK